MVRRSGLLSFGAHVMSKSFEPSLSQKLQQPDRRSFLHQGCAALATLTGLGAGVPALAQTVPPAVAPTSVEQLHMLCSGPPGSIPDIVARRVAEQMSGRYAQRIAVENRPGAAGQIAVAALKSAPADGSTILLAQGAVATVYPYLYAKLAYDPLLDLQPVSTAGEMTLALAIGPAVPESVRNLAEFIEWLRRNPKLANVASPGTGTLPHLLEAMLFRAVDVPWQHIVYSGGPPAMTDLLGGQIAALVLPEGLFRQHKASGRLRMLATSGATRSTYFPDVPSLVELGHPNLVVREWFAFFMAARVPAATIAAASQAFADATVSKDSITQPVCPKH
jgi:tripartite-type tricarboxylate transporter receptor subunit TctC